MSRTSQAVEFGLLCLVGVATGGVVVWAAETFPRPHAYSRPPEVICMPYDGVRDTIVITDVPEIGQQPHTTMKLGDAQTATQCLTI